MTQFATLPNGQRLAYRRHGIPEVAPLVLLHGFCENASLWSPVLPHLSARNIVCIELPGFGESDTVSDATLRTYANAVKGVLDALDIAQCCLVGHSLGGYTALAFAAQYAPRLLGLGLVHSHPFTDTEAARESRRQGITLLEGGKKDLYVKQLFDRLFTKEFATKRADVVAELVAQGVLGPAQGMIDALNAMMMREAHTDTLAQLAIPVFFALGEEDVLVPKEMIHEMIHLPNCADIHIWPNVAHMSMYEAPELLGPALNTFAESVGA